MTEQDIDYTLARLANADRLASRYEQHPERFQSDPTGTVIKEREAVQAELAQFGCIARWTPDGYVLEVR